MRLYGTKGRYARKDVTLKEITINCKEDELDKIINFLLDVKKYHSELKEKTPVCHTHLRDWDKTWRIGRPDIIIYTKFND